MSFETIKEMKQSTIDTNELKKKIDKRIDVGSLQSETRFPKNIADRRIDIRPSEKQMDSKKEVTNNDAEPRRFEFESKEVQNYLKDMVEVLKTPIPDWQLPEIKNYFDNNNLVKLDPQENFQKKKEFSGIKNSLIKEWERKNNKEWPRYEKDVLNKDGRVIRRAGAYYDAHHIIELSYGGPSEVWNIIPARYPDQHQNGIHKCESTKVLYPNERVYNR